MKVRAEVQKLASETGCRDDWTRYKHLRNKVLGRRKNLMGESLILPKPGQPLKVYLTGIVIGQRVIFFYKGALRTNLKI